MYKFEVYVNTIKSPILPSRYVLGDYILERTINPVWNDLELAGEKKNGRMFFRESLRGTIRLVDDDYDWAYNLFRSEYEINKFRYLKISENDGGLWTEVWKGFLNIADGEYNISKCFVEFSDMLTFDRYSTVLESIKKEKNMIDVPATAPVNYVINQYNFDEIKTYDTDTINSNFCGVSYGGVSVQTTGLKYVLYRKQITVSNAKIMVSPSGTCSYSATLNYTYTYRRDWQYADSDPGPDWDDSGEVSSTGVTKWVRYYRGENSPSYGLLKTSVTPQFYPSFTEVRDAGCGTCNLHNYDYTSTADANNNVQNDRARLFWNVIDYIIDGLITYTNPSNLLDYRLRSQFFLNNTNPITEDSNKLQNLVIWQLSDMKTTSDAATIANYSFSTIEEMVKMWQVFWYIDDSGRMWFEHQKFFDQGLSYTDNSVGMDISSEKITTGRLIVTYIDDLPQEERMKFQNALNADFIGVPITYDGNIVNRDEDTSVVEYSFNNVSTDLNQVTSNQGEVGNDGFFIAVTEVDGSELNVMTGVGILTNPEVVAFEIYNVFMAVSYLHDYYWKWGRSLSSGTMNNISTEFTQKAVIRHEDVVVVNCGSFDPHKLVKTEYGDGKVEEYVRTLKDKKLTMTLLYNA